MSSFRKHFPEVPRLVMFDLDGTLVDSVPDLVVAVDTLLTEQGYNPAGEDKVRCWVGNGAEILVRRALADALSVAETDVDAERVKAGLQQFLQHYRACNGQHSRLYPGVYECLQRLHSLGSTLVVVTNKPLQFVPHLLTQLGIEGFFTLSLGGDSLPVKKPNPAPLNHVLETTGIGAESALMVGDSRNDIAAAQAAGVAVLAVDYGYNHGRPVAEENPDWLTGNLDTFFAANL